MTDLGRLALDAALAGAGVAREALERGGLSVGYKASHRDVVTDADRAAEAAIIRHLRQHRPHDAILGEEGGVSAGATNVRWIIDPIDGTANFARGRNDFATAVAVEVSGTLAASAIVRPATGEWAVGDGAASTASTGTFGVSGTQQLSHSLVSISVALEGERRQVTFGLLQRLLPDVQDFRRTGSTSCDLLAVATGQLDAYLGVDTKEWDIAPGWALVEAAGGRCLRLPLAGGREALLVGTPAVVDQLAPLVERHASTLATSVARTAQQVMDPAQRAALAFPAPAADAGDRSPPPDPTEGGQPAVPERDERGARPRPQQAPGRRDDERGQR